MTYREQKESRAERLRGWAGNRVEKAEAVIGHNRIYTGDIAFNTQPGHIPLRARVIAQNDRAFESIRKAEGMASRARGIEGQLAESIYSDDPDAVERLTEKLGRLIAEREAIKTENAAFRKANREQLKGMTAWERDNAMPHRAYVGQNLTGVITNTRQRLEGLQRQTAAREAVVETETQVGDIVVRTTAARVEVEFPGKPSAEIRTALKGRGFRWDPVKVCWYGRDEAFAIEVAKEA